MSVAEIGLWLMVGLSALGAVGPRALGRTERATAVVGSGLVAWLGWQFLIEDWSSAYVVDHARPGLSPLLRTAGLWAGAEGSLLLWTTFVAWAAVFAVGVAEPARARSVRRLGSGLTAAYGLVLVLAASPFERLAAPANGGLGLQPVLEHPAMVWHPPLLYAGLVGLLVPSIVAASAGLGGHDVTLDRASLTIPLALLTVGLVTGAVWANVELGWGGYWAWDPIESAGLVAWLCGVAAVHGSKRSRDLVGGGRLAIALLVAPGLAALGATTVTRIGVVASVHAFANRPGLRLGLLTVAAGAAVVAMASVALATRPPGEDRQDKQASGRRTLRLLEPQRRLAVVVLVVAALFVAVGTYEPAIEAATSGDRLAISGHYYTRLLWPLVVVGAAFAVRADRRWWPAVAGACVGAVVVPLAAGPFAVILGAAGGGVSGSVVGRRRPGAVAHFGVGLALIGVAGTVATTVSTISVGVDVPVEVDGLEVVHRSIELRSDAETRRAVAVVEVDGVELRPELVTYERRLASTAEVGRHRDGLDEVQIVLLDGDAQGARYRLNRLPRVGLVWLGAAILAVGLAGQPLRRLRARSSETVDDSSPSDGASAATGFSGGDVGTGSS